MRVMRRYSCLNLERSYIFFFYNGKNNILEIKRYNYKDKEYKDYLKVEKKTKINQKKEYNNQNPNKNTKDIR